MHKSWKAVAGVCMLFAALFVGANAAGAQECGGGGYFDQPCELLEFEYPATVTAGGSISIDGSISEIEVRGNRASDDTVEFTIADQAIGSADVQDDGTFAGTFTVPDVAAGDYTIVGTSGDLSANGPITIVRAGTGTNNGNNVNTANNGTTPLARTGFDATPMVTLGAAALVLGAAAVYGSKRRRMA